ncbi:hypothetical protein DKM44_00370 [Deinococcus irradiatisoli]|uniref:DUF2726 domain-containing protein n=1 Tax=Deinococcus irradiatisoli TaxID=2202254 RepID=A0A2Z3JEQ8_9DEIO|nr:DUF2726 domain-containing protein [Deinococcus irradiatisoli]AWN21880.1 hypothetical protein DKM44_00370 [Deinococcus irradiatisoli]
MVVVLLLLALLAFTVIWTRHRRRPALSPAVGPGPEAELPASFPVQARPRLFSRSESQFYEALLEALQGSPYTAFPNVRLSDLFSIQASGSERLAVLGRLRDTHVDFLVVERVHYRPALGIELDGASHGDARQQSRDAVEDLLFASAELPLLRLDARRCHTPRQLQAQLAPVLAG